MTEHVEKAKEFFRNEEGVTFAYLFGSVATGTAGALSDIDFAVFIDERLDIFMYRFRLMDALSRALKSDSFDLVVLNDAPIVLAHEIIGDGVVLKDDRERRITYETQVLREYLDTAHLREVQRDYLRDQLRRRDPLG